ncbi:hypothetical protein Hypma_014043 [Hypsizygus marmoreus]|uniref:Mid2 domain-containing protein n=1 Tax=Hypsizygus marmoreus TaxID=39966 RepID=A0A369KBT1_HYPMA|nr:hypothetical protein Hypma_014043 [Hypsizygus marmoreus]
MQSLNYVAWAIALSFSTYATFASPAPFQSVTDRTGPAEGLLAVYPRQALPPLGELASGPLKLLAEPGDSDASKVEHQLPPVNQVFQMLEVNSGFLLSSTVTSITPTTATPVLTEATTPVFLGPGLVVPSTTITDSVPTVTAQPTPTSTASSDVAIHKAPRPSLKLVVIASVIATIIGLTFCVYALVNRRVFGRCRRQKKTPRETWVKFGLSPDKEKESAYAAPWLKYSPSTSTQGLSIEPSPPRTQALPPSQAGKIIDIVPDYPPSKFSVVSSEYPSSADSSPNSSLLIAPPTHLDKPAPPSPTPLMSPNEFFCLPSAPDLQSDSHHSRAHSAPILYHSLPSCDPSNSKMRSGDHRRSKSVSGLSYIVESPRESCSEAGSSGEWKRSSPQTGGFLCAF